MLRGPGLEFAVLDVAPIRKGEVGPKAPGPMAEQIARFSQAIARKSAQP